MTIFRKLTAAGGVLISVLESRPAAGQADLPSNPGRCASLPPLTDPLGSAHWTSWGVGVTNTRFQPADQARLTIEQVPNLKLKWAFGFANAGAAYAQPMIAGGRLFVGSQNGSVFALDAKSGCTYWTFTAAAGVRSAMTLGTRRTAGKEAYTLYFGDIKARVYALDAATGDLLWARKLDDHQLARVTGASAFRRTVSACRVGLWWTVSVRSVRL
jgi:polyvinyl alcohol dehydrogenase (cytochrome)